MLIPYRVKAPVSRFPIATVTIIAINVLVYLLTIDGNLMIKEHIALRYAFGGSELPILNVFTGAFLHADIFHVGGNMLFLWVFGQAVEDRLGIPKFLAVYLGTGVAGSILQAVVQVSTMGQVGLCIGASGCVMGLLGAYWYLFSWSPVCIFYWIYFYVGTFQLDAFWVIGLYLLMDLFNGVISAGFATGGGVAYFAHVGGGIVGVLFCIAMRAKRDTDAVSEARALQADLKDMSLLPLHALEPMVEHDPMNPQLLRLLMNAAQKQGKYQVVDRAMSAAGPELVNKDPALVAYYLKSYRGQVGIYHPAVLMRLAKNLEQRGDKLQTIEIYQLLLDNYPETADAETALYNMAYCYWNGFRDVRNARNCLREMARRFPNGPMTQFGRSLWAQMDQASKANPTN
ncbi:MAG TPA: rhomboid family intramembrane serine protease [Armatimonadota bacterium]|nr:rhomboid family intramembrane serine protease [Armatimonadota bacterium]